MRTRYFILVSLLIFISAKDLSAQKNKAKFGIQASNLFTVPFFDNPDVNQVGDLIQGRGILRYSIGGFFRKVLGSKIRMNTKSPAGTRSGVIAFDYGLNLVFKGFEYEAGNLLNTTDQLALEVPLLIVYYDKKNVFFPRKWYRKGIASYGRMGFKPSYLFKQNYTEFASNSDGEKLVEQTEAGGLNILWKLGIGILREKKNGGTTFVEFSANLGFIVKSNSNLAYEDSNGSIRETSIKSGGTYFDLKVGHIFNSQKRSIQNAGEKTPLIYNPRF